MLTDNEIDSLVAAHAPPIHPDFKDEDDFEELARAIESAATAPLLAEIERLKKRLAYANEVIDQRNAMLSAQQEERRHLWDGSPMPNYTITRELPEKKPNIGTHQK